MDKKLVNCLFWLRISVALIFIMWTIDKIIYAEHAARVFARYYLITGVGETIMIALGIAELIILILFLIGKFKNFTYLFLLIIHAISTVSTYGRMLDPFAQGQSNLLYFTAIPMLAACWMLYVFRHEDVKYNI